MKNWEVNTHIDGLEQDCSISIANALEILQSCTKSSILSLLIAPWNPLRRITQHYSYQRPLLLHRVPYEEPHKVTHSSYSHPLQSLSESSPVENRTRYRMQIWSSWSTTYSFSSNSWYPSNSLGGGICFKLPNGMTAPGEDRKVYNSLTPGRFEWNFRFSS